MRYAKELICGKCGKPKGVCEVTEEEFKAVEAEEHYDPLHHDYCSIPMKYSIGEVSGWMWKVVHLDCKACT